MSVPPNSGQTPNRSFVPDPRKLDFDFKRPKRWWQIGFRVCSHCGKVIK